MLRLDTNCVENAIRPFVIGRKNWLFSDTLAGAESSAALYSLIPLGVFRAADAGELGYSRWALQRLTEKEVLVRLGHGVYHHAAAQLDPETLNYTLATLRYGEAAVIGGRTALFHHALLDEGPSQVWVMVPHTMKARATPLFRLLRTSHDPTVGVVDFGSYRMATAERAVVEAFPKIYTHFLLERAAVRLVADELLARHLVFKGGFVSVRVYQSPRHTSDLDALIAGIPQELATSRVGVAMEKDLGDSCWFQLEGMLDLNREPKSPAPS